MAEYFAIVTNIGKRKMLEAINNGEKIDIVDFAAGDGGGIFCNPSTEAIALQNEVWRGKVDSCHISEESENVLIVETVMPSDVGGFTIREMGLFDKEGDLIAVCNVPDTQKVRITDGVVHELNLIMEIALDNIAGVELVVDPCVLMATKKDIENINKKLGEYFGCTDNPDGGIGFIEGLNAKNVVDAINKLFSQGNENKQKLVDNLIAVGIQASTDDTWGRLLDKVLDATDTSNDTVTAPVLLTGYTAHDASGEQISGEMPEMASVTVEATSTAQDDEYTYLGLPDGHYSEDSKVRTKNSNLGNAYYLGTGTSFNIKNRFPNDYQRFNSNSFIATISDTRFGGRIAGVAEGRDILGGSKGGISTSYNSSTGVLTVGPTQWHTTQTSDGSYDNIYFYATYKVYLIDGTIK